MRIKIAHEGTIELLNSIRLLTDYDFAIAPYVLGSQAYARFYRDRPKGRELILDNGKFELGESLVLGDLLKAAEIVKPNYVVAPDTWGDVKKTVDDCSRLILESSKHFEVAAIVVGNTVEEHMDCFEKYKGWGIKLIGWSHRALRAKSLSLLKECEDQRIHLFGFVTLNELRQCINELRGVGVKEVSMDTIKPVSAAHNGEVLRDIGRGAYKRPMLDDYVSPHLVAHNIGVFRGWIDSLGEENG